MERLTILHHGQDTVNRRHSSPGFQRERRGGFLLLGFDILCLRFFAMESAALSPST